MAETRSGLRALLALPWVYKAFNRMVGRGRPFSGFLEYARIQPGERVLDIGCGPGTILAALPAVTYYGFDVSAEYIAAARARYADRGTFRCEPVASASVSGLAPFDVALAVGVLHHLDDAEAQHLFVLAHDALAPGARLVTIDPCYAPGQSRLSRFLVRRDRGRNVRDVPGYLALAGRVFAHADAHIRHDLLRIPYTHVILECRREP